MLSHELSGALGSEIKSRPPFRGLILKGYDGKPHVVRTKSEGKVFIPALQVSILARRSRPVFVRCWGALTTDWLHERGGSIRTSIRVSSCRAHRDLSHDCRHS